MTLILQGIVNHQPAVVPARQGGQTWNPRGLMSRNATDSFNDNPS
ncbi:hypothetical protein EV11_0475 [Prochlorococcus sp. SS52]|nr:hypothetical protein EV04_1145 [Prochlorococcus marinus str. LG]KGG21411.1 hypothetical protein EV08_0496 [Prochlorococcus marinus str. SS2]KGG23244.1 hypothetical protein EV09_1992 [Prochlorococcus marinus str. SS35]KGG33956.1 hypothetical protein EV10_0395 [Prochlorococcus marinus str. SS51]KGG36695.1 hypothetical protein EV11_0475 [Prochlorococcus sp. SS52]